MYSEEVIMTGSVFMSAPVFLCLTLLFTFAPAQTPPELRGAVTDESGAVIPGAQVTLDDHLGRKISAESNATGNYRIAFQPSGDYTLTVTAAGFASYSRRLDLSTVRSKTVNVTLQVVITEQVEVRPESGEVSTEPDQNLSATTLSAQDLTALPEDRDELLPFLRTLAGPGDNAALYVDGFTDDRLPPKDSVQMVRINTNPFSAEFSDGGRGRIEVVTKPGAQRTRGSLRYNFADEALNARNAFALRRAPLQVREFTGNIGGAIIRNRWGYFFEFEREAQDENSEVFATVLDRDTLQPRPFYDVVVTPARETEFTVRTDYLMGARHTMWLRYHFEVESEQNQGLGGFDLPERAFDSRERDQSLRFSFTSIINDRVVNEMRLGVSRRRTKIQALDTSPAVIVLDSFSAGGNQDSLESDNLRERLEFADNLSLARKRHTIKTGLRARGAHMRYFDRAYFGGAFTFGSDFERDSSGQIALGTNGQPLPITPLETYRRTLLGLPGYRPSQFSIARGEPFIGFPQWDIGWFAQDDWRVSPRLTLSFGLRQEIETDVRDKLNFSPRFALAWSPDKKRESVLRLGAGIFYDTVDTDLTFDVLRSDGLNRRQYVISQPEFFQTIPENFDELARTQPALRAMAADLDAPYLINTNISYERKWSRGLSGSIGYSWQRGVHLLRTRNINAPLPHSTNLPFPDQGPILRFESTGVSTRHEIKLNWQYKSGRLLTMFGNYTLAWMRSDTDNAGTPPSNSYDLAHEFGRAGSDQRHRFSVGGTINLPGGWRFSPLAQAASGRPFNITIGRDINGDTIFTDRPTLAAPGDPEAIITSFGVFNPNPRPSDRIIPRNFGRGPGYVYLDLNFAKTFGFGGRDQGSSNNNGKQGDARFKLTLGANIRNILNQTNLAGLSGVLSSPRFGTANRALTARRVALTLNLSF
jgi:hypothetical protein